MSKRDDGWSDQGGYMAARKAKLVKQFSDKTIKQKTEIFSGVCIFVNGFTEPTDYILKEIMQENGGRFCHYYSRDTVTHTVTNNLPQSKIIKLKDEKIVTPTWITDSVAAGRLLDWTDYQLYADRHHSNQKMMKNFVRQDSGIIQASTGAMSISQFYNKSRLHHLSSWTTELSSYLDQLRQSHSSADFPARNEFRQRLQLTDSSLLNHSAPLIMHVDMDCFFVSVALRNNPHLKGKPVAVTHSKGESSEGKFSMSEVASCSYEARKVGVKNGMLLGKARTLCPDLVTVPYSFDDYLSVARTLYETVSQYTMEIEAGSCDELYLDLSDVVRMDQELIIDPLMFADWLRQKICVSTGGCVASCGVGANPLTAKLATGRAKPDGRCWLREGEVEAAIGGLGVRTLPGIGRALEDKLATINVKTCDDLQKVQIERLKTLVGAKMGQRLHDQCRGKDSRILQVNRQRKSISAEINYGIRMTTMDQLEEFMRQLAQELTNRMRSSSLLGELLILKVMIRHPDADQESKKYMGHGICDNFSRSTRLPEMTDDHWTISKTGVDLFKQLHKPVEDLRGVGLTMQNLSSSSAEVVNKNPRSLNDFFKPKSSLSQDENIENGEEDDVDEVLIRDPEDADEPEKDCVIVAMTNCPIINDPVKNKESRAKNAPVKVKKTVVGNSRGKQKISANQLTISQMLRKRQPATHSRAETEENRTKENRPVDPNVEKYMIQLGQTSLDRFKEALLEWVKTEKMPLADDVAVARSALLQMADNNVADVRDCMCLLRTAIERNRSGTAPASGAGGPSSAIEGTSSEGPSTVHSTSWQQAYRSLVCGVQGWCRTQFGAALGA